MIEITRLPAIDPTRKEQKTNTLRSIIQKKERLWLIRHVEEMTDLIPVRDHDRGKRSVQKAWGNLSKARRFPDSEQVILVTFDTTTMAFAWHYHSIHRYDHKES
ncbi:MAG TPA: hypothetical protein VFX43_08410 [Chitinophagaceae bacterium]|nr:hypothetical protein [Chitinophagaceae bacterium]